MNIVNVYARLLLKSIGPSLREFIGYGTFRVQNKQVWVLYRTAMVLCTIKHKIQISDQGYISFRFYTDTYT